MVQRRRSLWRKLLARKAQCTRSTLAGRVFPIPFPDEYRIFCGDDAQRPALVQVVVETTRRPSASLGPTAFGGSLSCTIEHLDGKIVFVRERDD